MKPSTLLTLFISATTLTCATPTQPSSIIPKDEPLIYPYATYRYWVSTGQLKEDPQDQLLIVKNGVAADESTTIVTFAFDASLQGRTCKLLFDLWDRDVSTGSQTADVFTVIDPPGADVSVTVANFLVQSRDKHVGRVRMPKPGSAEWVMAYYGMPEFACPAGQMMGVEFVGVGDNVEVRWDIGVTGPRVQVL